MRENNQEGQTTLEDDEYKSILLDIKKRIQNLEGDLIGLRDYNVRNDKVFKSANSQSVIHVSCTLLHKYKENKTEDVYKGKVTFTITEINSKTNKARKTVVNGIEREKYLSAFVNKAKTKVLMSSIISHTFGKSIYNLNGFVDYGGTHSDNPDLIRSRIMKVSLTERNQYLFRIEEGKGEAGQAGNITMVGTPEVIVERYIPYEEALELAHEVYDYIRDQEMIAVVAGKPLCTLSKFVKKNKSRGHDREGKEEFLNKNVGTKDNYVINVDPWKGKSIESLQNDELRYILIKAKDSKNQESINLFNAAAMEAKRRISSKS